MTHQEIIEKLKLEFSEIEKTGANFTEEKFFKQPATGKWSAAENVQHLFLSAKPLVGLFGKPENILQQWGKSNRQSRGYDELVKTYLDKVSGLKGAAAISNPQTVSATKAEQMENLHAIHSKFLERAAALPKNILDEYQIPHPLLGLLTVREFLYFTHYHTQHHHKALKGLMQA